MSRSARSTRRTPRQSSAPETLEVRALLSTVSINFSKGDLVMVGDANDNFVGVYRQDGDIVVGGFDGTKLSVPEFPGLEVDVVRLDQNFIPDDIRMKFNKGGDNLVIFEDGLTIGGDVQYVGGKQKDYFGINDAFVGGNMSLKTGNGEDILAVKETTVRGSLKINTGNDDDKVGLDEAAIDLDLVISTGKGDDQIGIIDSHVGDDAIFKTGSGNDAIFVYFSTINDTVKVALGSGNDDIVMDTTSTGATSVNAGSGRDAVEFEDLTTPVTPKVKGQESNDMANEGDRALDLEECIEIAIPLD